ncbi:MAG TPA: hypothetical protein DCM67_03400 [Propionibacteriaceae bacterium]|nr:hypothetical protein [Propionibacteriaceae bacterium]
MIERLPVANRSTLADASAAFTASDLAGTLLAPVWLLGRIVCPIVLWDHEALNARLSGGVAPVLDRAAVRDEVDTSDPPVLEIRGFVTCGDLRRSEGALAALSYYGATVLATQTATDWDVWQCQLDGHWLVQVHDGQAITLNAGRASRRAESRPTAIQSRLMVEQLFDVALRVDALT